MPPTPMLRRLSCFIVLYAVGGTCAAFGQSPGTWNVPNAPGIEFPYEAIVRNDNAAVHSGNGTQFYQTNTLARGTRVLVHRHDPGGWRMIAPPEEAFSLVPAESVRQEGNMAEVIGGDVSTRVGSHTSDDISIEQVPLRYGSRLEIVPDQEASEGWIAVRPPRGEYRWIRADDLEPADPPASQPKTPPHTAASDAPLPVADSDSGMRQFDSLEELDRQLHGLEDEDPRRWPLEALALGYLRLKRSHLELATEIDARLARINELKDLREERLGLAGSPDSPHDRRGGAPESSPAVETGIASSDASARQTYRPGPSDFYPTRPSAKSQADTSQPEPRVATPAAPPDVPAVVSTPPASEGAMAGPTEPIEPTPEQPGTPPAAGDPVPASGPPPQSQSKRATAKGPRRFDAVGYLQRAIDPPGGAPDYVLVSREGRMLSYLRLPPAASVDQYVGYPMGVDGTPTEAAGVQLPVIDVKQLTPVRFQNSPR